MKSGEESCPARKSRRREDSGDFIKEVALLRIPIRSIKKRQNRSVLNSIRLSGEIDFLLSFTRSTTEPTPSVAKDVVSSGMGKAEAKPDRMRGINGLSS